MLISRHGSPPDASDAHVAVARNRPELLQMIARLTRALVAVHSFHVVHAHAIRAEGLHSPRSMLSGHLPAYRPFVCEALIVSCSLCVCVSLQLLRAQ